MYCSTSSTEHINSDACNSKETENIADDSLQKSLHTIEHVWQESDDGPKQLIGDAALLGLAGEGSDGVNGAVDISGQSDLVASHELKHFHELSWQVKKHKTGHVGNNSGKIKSVGNDGTGEDSQGIGNISTAGSSILGKSVQNGDKVKLKLLSSRVLSLAEFLSPFLFFALQSLRSG